MALNFTATINGVTYTDQALFEVAALAFRAEKKAAAPNGEKYWWDRVAGDAEAEQAAIRRMWRTPRTSNKPFAPSGLELGATVSLSMVAGYTVSAQVWCRAPEGGVWAVTDSGTSWWVHEKTLVVKDRPERPKKTGLAVEPRRGTATLDDTQPAAA
jgi:hypothetical protein